MDFEYRVWYSRSFLRYLRQNVDIQDLWRRYRIKRRYCSWYRVWYRVLYLYCTQPPPRGGDQAVMPTPRGRRRSRAIVATISSPPRHRTWSGRGAWTMCGVGTTSSDNESEGAREGQQYNMHAKARNIIENHTAVKQIVLWRCWGSWALCVLYWTLHLLHRSFTFNIDVAPSTWKRLDNLRCRNCNCDINLWNATSIWKFYFRYRMFEKSFDIVKSTAISTVLDI